MKSAKHYLLQTISSGVREIAVPRQQRRLSRKRLVGALVFGFIALGVFFAPTPIYQAAHAQSASTSLPPCPISADSGLALPQPTGTCDSTKSPTLQTSSGPVTTDPSEKTDKSGCGISGGWDICISNLIYFIAVALPGYFLNIAALVLDIGVNLALQSTTYALDFLSQGWTVMRDLANMGFLFILIYIAMVIILKAETGSTMATLGTVIGVALILNFSFFFTRVVIDAGNIAAIEVYNAIPAPSFAQQKTAGNQSFINSTATEKNMKDLSAGIMSSLNVQNLLSTDEFKKFTQDKNTTFSLDRLIVLGAIYIGIGIITIVLAFALLVAGVQFLSRIVMLWVAIVASPIAFASLAVPKQKKIFDLWATVLLKNSFYPAIFLFMFLFIIILLKAVVGQSGTFAEQILHNVNQIGTNPNASFLYGYAFTVAVIAIELGLVVIMIKKALEFSEDFATGSAHTAHSFAGWVGGRYFGTVSRAGALVGQKTIGLGAYSFANSAAGAKLAAKGGVLGRTLWRGADKLGNKSWDARNTKSVPGIIGYGGGKDALQHLGKPKEGGYGTSVDVRTKRLQSASGKIGGIQRRVEQEEAAKVAQEHAPKATEIQTNISTAKDGIEEKKALERKLIEDTRKDYEEKKTDVKSKTSEYNTALAAFNKINGDIQRNRYMGVASTPGDVDRLKKAEGDRNDADAKRKEAEDLLNDINEQRREAHDNVEREQRALDTLERSMSELNKTMNKQAESAVKTRLGLKDAPGQQSLKKQYAESIGTRNLGNFYKAPHALFIGPADSEVANNLRTESHGSSAKAADILKAQGIVR